MVSQTLPKLSPLSPVPSDTLPLTLISLNDWGLVTVTGIDSQKYLQGQVTADINILAENQHVLTAHCDAKGKMWSSLRLFHRGEGYAYIERRGVIEKQLAELKKYAVFSKVVLAEDTESLLLGIAGENCRDELGAFFPVLPDADNTVIQHGATTLLHFSLPQERFLLITDTVKAAELMKKLPARLSDSQQWLALDIEAGFPVIEAAVSAQLVPQAVNLQNIEGSISFEKGMYMGLATIARTKYRGVNKRAMYWLAGNASYLPAIGSELEWQLGSRWRKTGIILSSLRLADGTVWIQAVLGNEMEADSLFRLPGDEGCFLGIKN
ncbi:tRNA-modifying protein YgfZ [Xenorhabdus innexi]|uniref:tRNA-modifying protein YgfZ n=1 Tax=Xenorhabdus innexi TaxID=290109 RepID=A0A1N6MTT3_9GAMM|nr:tRNA-modifying protein YgfZ [Xenorhabdus innexi]PHM33422.1 folate-binding protein [Xenorhabdus innexi]SIP72263.1 tRNA-modifying protein ygfZ [Xenorhabdus innexi]